MKTIPGHIVTQWRATHRRVTTSFETKADRSASNGNIIIIRKTAYVVVLLSSDDDDSEARYHGIRCDLGWNVQFKVVRICVFVCECVCMCV